MKLLAFALATLSPFVVYAADPCPCAGGTAPAVGQDACGKDVCDESLKKKTTEGCCADVIYLTADFCCKNGDKIPRAVTSLTPCTPNAPTENAQVNNQPIEIDGKNFNESKVINYVEYFFYIQIPKGNVSGSTSTFSGWSELSNYRDSSSECGGPIPGKTIGSSDWDPDLKGIASVAINAASSAAGAVFDVVSAATNTTSNTGAPTIYGGNGENDYILYGRSYKGKAVIDGGTWNGQQAYVTKSYMGSNGGVVTFPTTRAPVDVKSLSSLSMPRVEHRVCKVKCCMATDK